MTAEMVEMTLGDYVNQLPRPHKARQQYADLRVELSGMLGFLEGMVVGLDSRDIKIDVLGRIKSIKDTLNENQ